jgi:hypothetical protein
MRAPAALVRMLVVAAGMGAVAGLASRGLPPAVSWLPSLLAAVVAGAFVSRGDGRQWLRTRRDALGVGGMVAITLLGARASVGGWPAAAWIGGVEALVLTLVPLGLAIVEADEPRCPACGAWFVPARIDGLELEPPPPEVRRELVSGDALAALAELRPGRSVAPTPSGLDATVLLVAGTASGARYLSLELERCPSCRDHGILGIVEVREAWVNGRPTLSRTALRRGSIDAAKLAQLDAQVGRWRALC